MKKNIFKNIVGILNIIMGLLFMFLVVAMQGFFLCFFGFVYINLGIKILSQKAYKKLLFFGILPINILFSFSILMMGMAKDIPKYYQTPLYVGIIIILPFWVIAFFDYLLLKNNEN